MYRIFHERPTGREYWYGRSYGGSSYVGYWTNKPEGSTTYAKYNLAAYAIHTHLPKEDRDFAHVETVMFRLVNKGLPGTHDFYWRDREKGWSIHQDDAHLYKTRRAAEYALRNTSGASCVEEVSDWLALPPKEHSHD